MSEQKHPGTIDFVDQETGRRWSERATDVPEGMRFHDGVPIVYVVMSAAGPVFSTYSYGPNNELLRSSTGFRTPPPEPKHPGTITYVDEEKGTQWSKPAEELPERSRFQGDIPVVKVVFTAGEEMFIQAFGPNGELLRSEKGVR